MLFRVRRLATATIKLGARQIGPRRFGIGGQHPIHRLDRFVRLAELELLQLREDDVAVDSRRILGDGAAKRSKRRGMIPRRLLAQAEKVPKLLGVRFTIHNGAIVILSKDGRRADAVLGQN